MKRFFVLLIFFIVCKQIISQDKAVFLNSETVWVDSLLSLMTQEEKIAQLIMVAAYSNKGDKHKEEITKLIEDYKIGGLMFLQGSPYKQAKLTNFFQSKSKIPLVVAIDAEWGVSMRLDSSLRFPWQMTLGAIEDNNLIYEMGVEIAKQCKLLGIHINFAPVVDVNSNPDNPIINNRSFGENPQIVSKKSIAYMKGMQDNNILACAKHFPGHGDTDSDSHKTLPRLNHSLDRLHEIDLIPFKKLINNGLGSVMVAHLNIPILDSVKNISSSLSKNVVTDLLKNELHFKGLAITDALNMKGVSNYYKPGDVDVKALLAGNDILLFSEDVPKAIDEIKKAIISNKISEKEIDERCRKVLLAKKWLNLDKYRPVDLNEVKQNKITLSSVSLNKKLVENSITLLQNYNKIVPIKRLDTLRIASVSIGESSDEFKNMMSNYAVIDHFHVSENLTYSEQLKLLNKLAKYNLVIASVHKSNANAWKSYKINSATDILLQSIALQNKMVLCVFANPYSLNSLLFTNNFDGLILGYQNSDLSQKSVAKAIFGGIDIKGNIPVTTNHFNINHGIKRKSNRLNYVSIDEVNANNKIEFLIDSIVENAIANKAMPGCQILIAKDKKIFFNKSYGYHTYKKNNKVKNSDLYDLASITKIAASVPLLMKMVDDNKLKLSDKISKYLPLKNTNKKHITIKEVLSHQSGLQSWIPFYKNTLIIDSVSGLITLNDTLYSNIKSKEYPHEVADSLFLHYSYIDTMYNLIYKSELGEKDVYNYSDLGYYMFKKIIENTYKDTLNNLLDIYFYKKLGMNSLGYLPKRKFKLNDIVPTEYDLEFRGQTVHGHVHDMGAAMQGGVGGHAGLFSNANDMAKIMQMFLEEGEYGGERYLSNDVIKEFVSCQFCDKQNRRGAGFDKPVLKNQEGGSTCKDCVSLESFGHSGFTGTLAWADPKKQIIYVFLSNRTYPYSDNKKLLDLNVRTEIMRVIFDSFHER